MLLYQTDRLGDSAYGTCRFGRPGRCSASSIASMDDALFALKQSLTFLPNSPLGRVQSREPPRTINKPRNRKGEFRFMIWGTCFSALPSHLPSLLPSTFMPPSLSVGSHRPLSPCPVRSSSAVKSRFSPLMAPPRRLGLYRCLRCGGGDGRDIPLPRTKTVLGPPPPRRHRRR